MTKKLFNKDIRLAIEEFRAETLKPGYVSTGSVQFDKNCYLHIPLGELTNDAIAGFLIAWKMRGAIVTSGIDGWERFNAQGLEGKAIVKTHLTSALIACIDIPDNRAVIVID
jgi:hypothetical protein